MNFTNGLFPFSWLVFGHLLFWPAIFIAVRCAPWGRLREPEKMHVWLGTIVAVLVMWTIQAGVADGQRMHLIGATLMTLMFGWQFALLGMTVVVLGVTAWGGAGWQALPLNTLVLAVVPVLLSYGVLRLVERRLPAHFFIYVFVVAFLGAAFAMTGAALSGTLALGVSGAYSFTHLTTQYLPFALLLLLPEAFITGMLMTLLVAYRPQWVHTFDDERYLKNK